MWNFDVVYEMMLIDIYCGKFGEDYRQTLENGGIELALYKDIPSAAKLAMKRAEEGIKSGRIKVSNIADTRKMRSYMRRLFK